MSYPIPQHDLDDFVRDVQTNLRPPSIEWDGAQSVAVFYPDLSASEQQTYALLVRVHRSRVGLTFADYTVLQPDLVGLRAFANLASPTAAQTAAAVKALIRVVRAILD